MPRRAGNASACSWPNRLMPNASSLPAMNPTLMSGGRSPRFRGTLGDLPPSCFLVALAGYLARKRSRTSLISVPCVQSMPCGASSISTYSAEGRRLMNSRPVESIGRMRSSVP